MGSVLRYKVLCPTCWGFSHTMVPSSVTVSTVAGVKLPRRSTMMTFSPAVSSFHSVTGLQRGRVYVLMGELVVGWVQVQVMFLVALGLLGLGVRDDEFSGM